MKKFDFASGNPEQYASLTEEEKQAWHHTEPHSYHSYHVERMGADTFRWRDSREAMFYVGTAQELFAALDNLKLRKVDPKFLEAQSQTQVLTLLSQQEVDDLLEGI